MSYWTTYYIGVALVPALVVFPVAFLAMRRWAGLLPLHRQWLPFLLCILGIAVVDFLGARTGLIRPSTTAMAVLRLGGPVVVCISILWGLGRKPKPAA